MPWSFLTAFFTFTSEKEPKAGETAKNEGIKIRFDGILFT